MNDLVAAVRGAGAAQPIVLSGLDYANEFGARPGTPGVDWLSSRPGDDQLVAGWHAYPGQQCDDRSCWDDEIAPVAAEVPVLITETGQDHAYATKYLDGLWSWALDHDLGWMQWAWWVFEPGEGDPGFRYEIIVDDVDYEPTPGPGSLLRWGLAATASGAKTLTASGSGSDSTASIDGKVKLKGPVRAGDETTVMVWLHRSDGNDAARVRLSATGGGAERERTSRRVELFDKWTPITLRLHARADHDKLRLAVEGGVRMRDVRAMRLR